MNYVFALLIPLIFIVSFLFASLKKVKVYDSFVEGAKKAIPLIISIFPYLATITMLSMLLGISKYPRTRQISTSFRCTPKTPNKLMSEKLFSTNTHLSESVLSAFLYSTTVICSTLSVFTL